MKNHTLHVKEESCLLGLIIYNKRLTGERYLDFLQNQLMKILEDVSLNVRSRMMCHHEGAPPHNS